MSEVCLSPKLRKLREKHRSVRRESLLQLEISKTALERRSSNSDQTVETVSSIRSSGSAKSVRVTKLEQHEQMPVMEEGSGSRETMSVSSSSPERPVEKKSQQDSELVSQQDSELETIRKPHQGKTEASVEASPEDSPPRLESITAKDQSPEAPGEQSEEPPDLVLNLSELSDERAALSQRLEKLQEKLQEKHRSRKMEATVEASLEDSPPRLESITAEDQSPEATGEQSEEPPDLVQNSSELCDEGAALSQRLEKLRDKHRSLRKQSLYKLEVSKIKLDQSIGQYDDEHDDDTANNDSTPKPVSLLSQHEELTLKEENEDVKEQISALLISQAVARKEYQAQAETIRKLRSGFHLLSTDTAESELSTEQRLQEVSLKREMLEQYVQDDKLFHQEQQQEFERLCENLSKALQQLQAAKAKLENQDDQDWLIKWSRSTGQEAKHLHNILSGLEISDQQSQKFLEALRNWLNEWSQVCLKIEDVKNQTKDSVTPPPKLVRKLSRKLGPDEAVVLKAETAQVVDKLRTLRKQLDATEDEDEIHELEVQIEEQLELWRVLESHMDDLAPSVSSRDASLQDLSFESEESVGNNAMTPANGSNPLSTGTDLDQSVEKLLALLREMQTMISNQESEAQSQYSVSPSSIQARGMIRISSVSSSSSWTPSSAFTLLLSMRQQQTLMEGIHIETSQIEQLQEQEKRLKSQLEVAQEQKPSEAANHQSESAERGAGVDNERQEKPSKLSMLEKQVEELRNENAALLAKIQDFEHREKAREQDPLSPTRSQEEVEPQGSPSSSDHSSTQNDKDTTESERLKLAYDTAQAYFASKREKHEEQSLQGLELPERQMNLSPVRPPRRQSMRSSMRSSSILEEEEAPSSRRQSRLLARHVIAQNDTRSSGTRVPLIFVDEAKVEQAQQVQQNALENRLKRFLGINW